MPGGSTPALARAAPTPGTCQGATAAGAVGVTHGGGMHSLAEPKATGHLRRGGGPPAPSNACRAALLDDHLPRPRPQQGSPAAYAPPMEAPAMRRQACIVLLLFLSACTTTPPSPREPQRPGTPGSPISSERRRCPGRTGGGAPSRRLPSPGPCWRSGAFMPSTMTGSSFMTPWDDARLPPRVPLPWGSGSASSRHRRFSWARSSSRAWW